MRQHDVMLKERNTGSSDETRVSSPDRLVRRSRINRHVDGARDHAGAGGRGPAADDPAQPMAGKLVGARRPADQTRTLR